MENSLLLLCVTFSLFWSLATVVLNHVVYLAVTWPTQTEQAPSESLNRNNLFTFHLMRRATRSVATVQQTVTKQNAKKFLGQYTNFHFCTCNNNNATWENQPSKWVFWKLFCDLWHQCEWSYHLNLHTQSRTKNWSLFVHWQPIIWDTVLHSTAFFPQHLQILL